MSRRTAYILTLFFIVSAAYSAAAQEVLRSSRIQARFSKRLPALGLPVRFDGQIDPAVWYDAGVWKGADSLRAEPFWSMHQITDEVVLNPLTPVFKLCADWASEKPKQPVDVVWGRYRGGWFVAMCKKTNSVLGWKTIGFSIPDSGIPVGKSIWLYSHSVNWVENQIGYNLFSKIPDYLQEIIEEMTATELLCSFQEFDPGLNEEPDREYDIDRDFDVREKD